MLKVDEVSPELIESITPDIENFLSNLKSGSMEGYKGISLSTAAAQEMVNLMSLIIDRFHEYENELEDVGSPTVQMRRHGRPEMEVVSCQVQRLLQLVARTSDALIRPQFGTLLLTNVTRRVLSIIRDAAAETRAPEGELAQFLHDGFVNSMDRSTSRVEEEEEGPLNSHGAPELPAFTTHGQRHLHFPSPTDTKVAGEIPGQQALRRATSSWQDLSSKQDLMSSSLLGAPNSSSGHPTTSVTVPPSTRHHEFPVRLGDFYNNCTQGLNEFAQEIASMTEELCNRVNRQIHRGDVIITIGCTHTVRQYLKAASLVQTFKVLLLDGAPSKTLMVDKLAMELAERNVEVQRLPDSCAFAVMNTCTKVVIGAESVLANGGMLGFVGTRMLCVAARHFAVPVLVATTTLKMSPYYPSDQLCSRLVRITKARAQELPWSIYGAPELVLPMPNGVWVDTAPANSTSGAVSEGLALSRGENAGSGTPVTRGGPETWKLASSPDVCRGAALITSQVSVHCAATEYVPPEYITLYATNESEFTPSQCHRIVRANYNDAD